jgi:uncharacterized membrane protein
MKHLKNKDLIFRLSMSILIIMLVFFSACTWHNEVEYFGSETDTCSTENMSYAVDINPVIQNSCVSCHSSGYASGGINLEGYENVKPYAQSGELIKVIKHEQGVSPMPQNSDKLPDCTINKINAWIEQGIKNN